MTKLWPKVGVGAVVWRGPDSVLLVRRAHPPRLGEWSLPGGQVEAGETLQEAVLREIAEETGLSVEIDALIDVVDFIDRDERGELAVHYVLIDFTARWVAGEACAASDAAACRWFSPAEAIEQVSWEETRRVIRASARALWQREM